MGKKTSKPNYKNAEGRVWFKQADYDTVREMLVDGKDVFPVSYHEWLGGAEMREHVMRRNFPELMLVRAYIDPVEFRQWCEMRTRELNTTSAMDWAEQQAMAEYAR